MGNKMGKPEDEFEKMVKTIKSKQAKTTGLQTKITINPEQKYLSVMIQKLCSSNLPQELKNKLSMTLHDKLSKEELIKTVSIANVLKNNEFDIQASKSIIISSISGKKDYSTKNVKFNFDFNKINPYIKKNLMLKHAMQGQSQMTKADLQCYERQLSEQEKRKIQEEKEMRDSQIKNNYEVAMKILRQQLKRMYHPFWKLNKTFSDYISNEFSQFLDSSESGCKKDAEKYEVLIRKLLYTWCVFLQEACLYPYKKWLMAFIQISQPKLLKALHALLLQQIFSINNSYLYHSVIMLISEHRKSLKINFSFLKEQQDYITPELFSINDKLQIEGNFFISIYECSELQSVIQKPQKILKQLELFKNSICKDIDEYHRLEEKKQFYEIDSDNILGIVNFILTRIPNKIDGIYKQIIFLRIIYGDSVYFTHGISSYMLSTLSGSMQFLESQQFMKLLKENPLANKKPISPPTMAKRQSSISIQLSQEQKNKQSTTTKPASPVSRQQKIREFLQGNESKQNEQIQHNQDNRL